MAAGFCCRSCVYSPHGLRPEESSGDPSRSASPAAAAQQFTGEPSEVHLNHSSYAHKRQTDRCAHVSAEWWMCTLLGGIDVALVRCGRSTGLAERGVAHCPCRRCVGRPESSTPAFESASCCLAQSLLLCRPLHFLFQHARATLIVPCFSFTLAPRDYALYRCMPCRSTWL